MARFFRMALVVVAAFAVAGSAQANIPSPDASDVPGMITITPDASFGYTVTVNGSLGPVNGANVEIRVSAQADPLVCWCSTQVHPSITGLTDVNGLVTFFIAGGGCIDPAAIGGGAVVAQVFADGIELGQVGINSPDAVNAAGALNTDNDFVFDPTCGVGLADAVFHTASIAGGLAEICSNFSDPYNDFVGPSDAVIVTPYIIGSPSCSP